MEEMMQRGELDPDNTQHVLWAEEDLLGRYCARCMQEKACNLGMDPSEYVYPPKPVPC